MKKVLVILLAICMVFSLVACGSSKTADDTQDTSATDAQQSGTDGVEVLPTQGQTVESVTVALKKNSWDLSPFNGSGSSRAMIWHQLYATLMSSPYFGASYDDLELDMAESVELSDDNLTAVITLRDSIHDNQGNAIKAEDVVFSYETACATSGYTKVAGYMSTIEATGDYEVTIVSNSNGVGTWECVLCTVPVISKTWYESSSEDERANNPATTGAYYVVENVVGTNVVLKLVEDFWQADDQRTVYEVANVDTIYYDCITESAMRTVAMETGEIDMGVISNEDIGVFLDSSDYTVLKYANAGSSALFFNCMAGSVVEDANIRKAILYAVDWEQVRLAAGGTADAGNLAHDLCAPCAGDYLAKWDEEDYFSYNTETATSYLEAAGLDTNSGLKVRVMCNNDTYKGAATIIQDYLAKVGIDVEILCYDNALFSTYLYESDQWDIVLNSATTSGNVTDTWLYGFDEISDEGTLGFVKDEKLQELLDAACTTHDEASLDAFHNYVIDQAYAMAMYYDETYVVAQKGISNIYLTATTDISANSCTFADDYASTAK